MFDNIYTSGTFGFDGQTVYENKRLDQIVSVNIIKSL